jgi:aminomethyltransferase
LGQENGAKNTALYEKHVNLGGKIVDFYGWNLPLHYSSGIISEHNAVRNSAGLFDVSHMGEIFVEGPGAGEFLELILTNGLEKLRDGGVLYSPMCYLDGGTVDDLIVYKMGNERFFIAVNASNAAKDFEWMQENAGRVRDVTVRNVSDEYSQLAIQGPKAETIMQKLCEEDLSRVRFFKFIDGIEVGGIKAILSRTGYTGEDGFEIYVDPAEAPALWDKVMEAGEEYGLTPAGLGARDTLRLEAGLPLYGHELSQSITPVEAGLSKFISFEKISFNGKDVLKKQHDEGLGRRLVGFEMIERGIPRADYEIESEGVIVGHVTSGTFSPTLNRNIGMALVIPELAEEGKEFNVIIRGKPVRGRTVKLPFNVKRYKNREEAK